jgi:hypothetical protein
MVPELTGRAARAKMATSLQTALTRHSLQLDNNEITTESHRGRQMHRSRLCAMLIDCNNSDVDEAARFWSEALGRSVDNDHPGSRGNYRMLATPPDEPIVQIQRVGHESRVHLDIETDDIPAEVARLEKLGAKVANRLDRWVVMQAPTGQHFCVVRVQRPGFPKNANSWE